MADGGHSEDVRAIEALIARQFGSLDWAPGRTADWAAFAGDFFPGAALYPSARPVQPKTVEQFVERMRGIAGTGLASFRERMLGADVHVFGNVAVALAACELTENDTEVSRGVEALLLVKDGDAWRIVAQAWDMEDQERPAPDHLLDHPGSRKR